MHQPLPYFIHPTFKQLLFGKLQAALDFYFSDNTLLCQRSQHFSLHLSPKCHQILYISNCAFQLSQVLNLPPLKIATNLAQFFALPGVRQDFTVQVVPPGWLQLEITPISLAIWLQSFVLGEHPPALPKVFKDKYRPNVETCRLFAIQYAHARCYSLLQLGERDGLIRLQPSDLAVGAVRLSAVAPKPIPWLNPENEKLRLSHPNETALITQLLRLIDNVYFPCPNHKQINWQNTALNLSQAFQAFYSSCQIWGEVKIKTPALAQARLGLVMVTQSALRLLLQEILGVSAPLEL